MMPWRTAKVRKLARPTRQDLVVVLGALGLALAAIIAAAAAFR